MMCHHKAPHRNFEPHPKNRDMFEGVDIPPPETFDDDYSTRSEATRAARMRVRNDMRYDDLGLIQPEGLLIKSDLTSSELAEAFQLILDNPPYYSSTVKGFVNTTMSSDIHLDDINRKILHLLSQGVKTKSLKEYIDLSMSAIEKRKKQLKLLFDVEDGKDESLLNEAREKGFL